ncbi:glycosyltransferase [Candidatus Gottesmanbacteria bacterium]|nr:glycosyltransferase [Candidatus Gottesmanbacteria bacterium]
MKFSIIIPFQEPSEYLYECLDYIQRQSYTNYEVILLPDRQKIQMLKLVQHDISSVKVIPTGQVGPAEKRDRGIHKATGEILAFIDDDAYPDKDWLKNALKYFIDPEISAVCGPGVTPSSDDIFQQASGWVNALWLGSGGAGTYRFTPQERRFVDDYPSMNFLVRKEDFEKAGGFDTHFWPGEDTKLCHDLVYILKKKIIYDPKVLVFHHRKPLFLPHLRQISRYALHRGHFARILPATSFRIGYLIPTFFVLFLTVGFLISLNFIALLPLYLGVIILYLGLLTGNIFYVILKTRSILIAVLSGCGIVLTHVIYGLLFPIGFLKKSLKQ